MDAMSLSIEIALEAALDQNRVLHMVTERLPSNGLLSEAGSG